MKLFGNSKKKPVSAKSAPVEGKNTKPVETDEYVANSERGGLISLLARRRIEKAKAALDSKEYRSRTPEERRRIEEDVERYQRRKVTTRLVTFIIIILLAVAAIAGFCYMLYCGGMYPFGTRSLMRIDLDTQYADFIQFFARSSFMEKLYSFQKGFGGPTLGFISYYAISPFNLIALLFSGENLETAVFVILAAKFVFMAEGMYIYLCSHYDGLYENAAFGLAYAFFPVFARWHCHIIWLDCFALLPLLILGTERVIHSGRKSVFTMLFLWSLISNYYITVMSAIFVLLYFVYYTAAVMGYDIKIIIKKTS